MIVGRLMRSMISSPRTVFPNPAAPPNADADSSDDAPAREAPFLIGAPRITKRQITRKKFHGFLQFRCTSSSSVCIGKTSIDVRSEDRLRVKDVFLDYRLGSAALETYKFDNVK